MKPGVLPLGDIWAGIELVQGMLALLGESAGEEMSVHVPLEGAWVGKLAHVPRTEARAVAESQLSQGPLPRP